jgi:hypothetical protein
MAPKAAHDPQYLDEDHQRISEFANDYFDDEEERGAFVDELLGRRGYQRTAGWAPPPPQDPPGVAGPARPRTPYFKQK